MERQFFLRSHPYFLLFYLIALFILSLGNFIFIWEIDVWLVIGWGIFVYAFILETIRTKKTFTQLVKNCDAIIDRKPLQPIEGEHQAAVLSSKLDILNQRYQAALKTHELEKIKLKNSLDHVSHQLKTPLTAIKINAELLALSDLNKEDEVLMDVINKQTSHLSYLVEQLLKLSRTNADAVTYEFCEWSFYDIFSELENTLSPLLLKSHVKLNYPFDETLFYCDQTWFLEALENIVKNCIEHAPNSEIDITYKHGEFMHRIEIQDHGKGFEIDEPNRIFEHFYHGKDSQGAGIGLALAKEIIRAHHGKINAYNHHGALFVIELPIYYTKESVNVTE